MHSIPCALTVTNPHKRHRTALEDPASSKRTKAENRVLTDKQPMSGPLRPPSSRLLKSLASVLSQTMIEWLEETDALQLMAVGKKYRIDVLASYYFRLKPTPPDEPCPNPISYPQGGGKLSAGKKNTFAAKFAPIGIKADHPVCQYRNPTARREQHLCNDQVGRNYLAAKNIYYPLGTKIGSPSVGTVAQAEAIIEGHRLWISQQISRGKLSTQQRETFKNPLFTEHVECERIDRPTALQVAEHENILFYSLSLFPLFRAGMINLSTVSKMSPNGIRLLHDPRCVNLLRKGLLSEQQVRTLTATQYRSLLLLVRPLLARQLRSSEALMLTSEQINNLAKAGLLEDLARCRISLKQALAHLEQKPKSPEHFALYVFDGAPAFQHNSASSSSSSISSRSSAASSSSSSSSIGVHEMLPKDVVWLMSAWPVEEMGKVLLDEDGNVDEEWVSAFIRVRQLVPSLGQHTISGDTLSIIKPRLCQSGVEHQKYQPGQKVGVPLTDVALLLSRMPTDIVHDVIHGEGSGGDADWVIQFGKIIHLMPFEKIAEFLNTQEEINGLFTSFPGGLGDDTAESVAQAFNQIFINLAEHLDADNYLTLLEIFLKNVLGFMVACSWRSEYLAIIDQCREIWSLLESTCVITGNKVDYYRDLAAKMLIKANHWRFGFEGTNGSSDKNTMIAFASLMVAMRIEDDEEFLKVWTDNYFSVPTIAGLPLNQDIREYLGYTGIIFCHAVFNRCRHSNYGFIASRCMGLSIDEAVEDFRRDSTT